MIENLTQYQTGSAYTQMIKTYFGQPAIPETNVGALPRVEFGDGTHDDAATVDCFRNVVSVLRNLPPTLRNKYCVEHELHGGEGARTKIIAPNGNFVQIEIHTQRGLYSADLSFKDIQRGRTRNLKIVDPNSIRKKAKRRKTEEMIVEKQKSLLDILEIPESLQ